MRGILCVTLDGQIEAMGFILDVTRVVVSVSEKYRRGEGARYQRSPLPT